MAAVSRVSASSSAERNLVLEPRPTTLGQERTSGAAEAPAADMDGIDGEIGGSASLDERAELPWPFCVAIAWPVAVWLINVSLVASLFWTWYSWRVGFPFSLLMTGLSLYLWASQAVRPADRKMRVLNRNCPVSRERRSCDTACAVCLDPVGKGQLRRTLKCNHFFHAECLKAYLMPLNAEEWTCPLCRGVVAPEEAEAATEGALAAARRYFAERLCSPQREVHI
eukprot:TRINITY_DN20049_c0_g1_i1.p2 TRINITY_DN20049_c0_g1~~TRINITY_DN20049_c0_g1_i1.p2  ORF type:complete len:264 (-),score=44.67 TRINITY_DN20049_c0_g1_i1:318-992(-)